MKKLTFTNEEIGSLCMALAHLLHAGIAVGDALGLLQADEQNAACREVLGRMAKMADEGMSLAGTFREAGCFPAYVCSLLEVGRQVGKTEETLVALAEYYREQADLNRRLRAALLYPAALLTVLLAVMVILLVWVLPVFNDVYAQLGSRLTGVAGGLLMLGNWLRQLLPCLCALLALGILGGFLPPVRRWLGALWKKHLADLGAFGTVNTARFVQAMAMALDSGMAEQEAAMMASMLAEDAAPKFRKRCEYCVAALESGKSLSKAMGDAGFLSPADGRLLDAGSRSGRSEQVMNALAQQQTLRSQEALERAVGRVEPALVAVSCVMIGTVLLSVMLPLMHIMTAIG